MTTRWYTRRHIDEAERGPFTKVMLAEAVKGGRLSGHTLVRREGKVEWAEIGDHPAFALGYRTDRADEGGPFSQQDSVSPPLRVPASPGLWWAALLTFILNAGIRVVTLPVQRDVGPEQVGRMIGTVVGAALVPYIIVLIAALWESNRTERARLRGFTATSLVLMIMALMDAFGRSAV